MATFITSSYLTEVSASPGKAWSQMQRSKAAILWFFYSQMHISEKEMQFKVKVLEHLGLSIVIFFYHIY